MKHQFKMTRALSPEWPEQQSTEGPTFIRWGSFVNGLYSFELKTLQSVCLRDFRFALNEDSHGQLTGLQLELNPMGPDPDPDLATDASDLVFA